MVKTTYRYCEGCQRRMAEQLFSASRCNGCHSDAKRKLTRKVILPDGDYFTEEEYEAMGEVNGYIE